MVASLATLVATSSAAKATFVVSVSGLTESAITNNPATPNNLGVQYQSTLSDGSGDVSGSISVTASQAIPVFSRLLSIVTIVNGSSSTLGPVTITITQSSYTFPVYPIFYNNRVRATTSGTLGLADIKINATNQLAQNPTFTTSGLYSTTLPAIGGSGPYSISQDFTITGLAAGSSVLLRVDTSITTPLPATGLMAAVGFPLLGLAGAFRRRVLG